jgi:hypothetical protein
VTKRLKIIATLLAIATLTTSGTQAANNTTSPQAHSRSDRQNFKDMVLATCVADAYRQAPLAARDAGSSVSALQEWSHYDMERAPDTIRALVDAYLARDYRNPLAEAEAPGLRFDFLKCLDLYHSAALDTLARRLTAPPARASRPRSR